jgi:hypothetical protein
VKKTAFDRWKAKVDMKGPNDCWEWLGFKHKRGYGYFKIDKKHGLAHRFAYAYYKNNGQPIPSNLYVCHHCDNPSCVNPNHLFLGSQKDNVQDMIRKGRRVNPNPKKHIEAEVEKIRKDYLSLLSLRKTAALNNTSKTTVHNIVKQRHSYER